MLIHCPMNPELFGYLEELVDLGADEFFFGYANNLEDSRSLISMRQAPHSSFPSLSDAAAAVLEIKKLGRRSFITINGMFYPDKHLDALIPEIAGLASAGCDGFIVSDLNFFLRLEKEIPGLYLVASSGAHAMNSRVVKFLQALGVRRCIFPRQLTPDEIREAASNCPGMDFEIFMKNEECAFLDGYCSYSHYCEWDDHPACNELYIRDSPLASGRMQKWLSCGACELFGMKDMSNLSLKICGRALEHDLICKDVAFLKKAVAGLGAIENKDEYSKYCRESYEEIYGVPCRERCYYGRSMHAGSISGLTGVDKGSATKQKKAGSGKTMKFETNYSGGSRDDLRSNAGYDEEQFPEQAEGMQPPPNLDSLEIPEQAPDIAAHTALLMSPRLSALEKAIYVSDLRDLQNFNAFPFSRLYFGNEYCEHLLPSRWQVERAAQLAIENRIGLTFVTPVCLDRTFPVVEALLDALPAGAEVVFNDWGLVESIAQRCLIPVHGRLLCAIRKDPRIASAVRGTKYHRTHNIQLFYQKFLVDNKVSRLELDNVPQRYELTLDSRLSASIYYPFVTCAITRKCAFANAAAGSVKYEVVSYCPGHCGGRNLSLDLEGESVLVKGNAHFFTNSEISSEIQKWNVTRLVYMPVFPNHNHFTEV